MYPPPREAAFLAKLEKADQLSELIGLPTAR
jgi:hypothetical protein